MNNENRLRSPDGVWEISVNELHQNLDKFELIDVRRPDEFTGELGHIDGAKLSTLQTDFQRLVAELDPTKTYAFICRSGQRSLMAGAMAIERGVKNVYNMTGGMIAWNEANLPTSR